MTDILIRGLDSKTVAQLKERAKEHGRSLQREAKLILEQGAAASPKQVSAMLEKWRHKFAARHFQQRRHYPRGSPAVRACVVDASMVAAALFAEADAETAAALMTSDRSLMAPDLIYAELGNVIWKRHGRGEINHDDAVAMVADVMTLPIRTTASRELLPLAVQLALQTRQSVYDCLYLALAVLTDSPMITTDARLVSAVAPTPLAQHVMHLGNVELG